jgi:hypothetical protein
MESCDFRTDYGRSLRFFIVTECPFCIQRDKRAAYLKNIWGNKGISLLFLEH